MTRQTLRLFLVPALAGAAFLGPILSAQDAPPPPAGGPAGPGGGRGAPVAGWATTRGDAQRTAAVRNDQYISVEDFAQPGFERQWSVTLSRTTGETLSEGVSSNTAQLNPAPGDVAGSANNVYGYEIDTGALVWTRHFDVPAPTTLRTAACPGTLTAGVTRTTPLSGGVVGGVLGRTGGAFGTYRGMVGAPGEGIPAEFLSRRGGPGGGRPGGAPGGPGAPGGAGAPGGPGAPGAPGAPARGAVPPGGPGGGGGGGAAAGRGGVAPAVYTITTDGKLRTVGQQQGKELAEPAAFLPANAHASSVTLVNGVLYATTINGCGGVANGLWVLDTTRNNAVTSWKSGASPAGPPAFSATGTIYVALGDGPTVAGAYANAVVALDAASLLVKDHFTLPGASFSTAPVVFSSSGREMVAAATKDGRVYLLDAASLGGADHKTPVAVTAATNTSRTWSPSAIVTWQDASQGRWLALSGSGTQASVIAFKVGGRTLDAGWAATIAAGTPSSPIVVNDVVFVLNQGSASAPAVLYALDGASGKAVWNSGRALRAASRTPLWSSNGHVFVATVDRTVHAFGYAQDRHQ